MLEHAVKATPDLISKLATALKPVLAEQDSVWAAEGPAAIAAAAAAGIAITYLGGNCPVQAEGTIDGED